jgi:DNA-directed RNA polymerase specialized sigma24 family protein
VTDETDITDWLERLGSAESAAAHRLWNQYYTRLVALACAKLGTARKRVADEEDVALSAFHSFCRGAREGRFPQLQDRDDLWRLLVVITARKATRLRKHERRQKRGGGRVRGESAFLSPGDRENQPKDDAFVDREPSPEFAAAVAEELQRLLDSLGDEKLRQIAMLKMEGYENREIADKLACGLRTVERRLRGIREIWGEELSV